MRYPGADLMAVIPQELDRVEAEMAVLGPSPLAAVPSSRGVPLRDQAGDIAIIRLRGFMTQKPSIFGLLGFGTSTEAFAAAVVNAMADPSVKAVVLDVDSGGGSVYGVTEAAARIRDMRGAKPLVAVANPIMASAAYHLASQADLVVATPSAIVGSIGAFAVHVDESGALAQEGLRVTMVTFGRRKAEQSSLGPLSDEARTALQEQVDSFGEIFVADVSRGRRVSVSTILSRYGEGASFTAQAALKAGLVDRIATLDQVVGRLGSTAGTDRAVNARLNAIAALTGVDWRAPQTEREPDLRPFDPAQLGARAALAGVKLFDTAALEAQAAAAGITGFRAGR